MNHRIAQKLWKDCDRCIQATVNGTEWTSSGYWIAHSSLVGGEPNHKYVEVLDRVMGRRQLRSLVADARPPGRWEQRQVLVDEHGQHLRRFDTGMTAVFVRAEWHDALHELTGGMERRADPWKGSVSWWSPRGYPVAILMGVRVPHKIEVAS